MSKFETEPRDFALELIEEGQVSKDTMIVACLKYMSHDDVREMLDMNELSPRFDEENGMQFSDDEDEDD